MGPKVRFDTTGFERRRLIILAGAMLVILAATVGLIIVLVGGKQGRQVVSEATSSAIIPTPTPSPSPLPSPTAPPTDTPTPAPTATLEPYQYVVQPGDTLYYIIQLFGYRDLSVVPEVIALNGMANENDLKANQVLLIPRQTPTPGPTLTPTPLGATAAAPETNTDYHGCGLENRCISADGQFWMHEVKEGDTPAGLAYAYDTTVRDIFQDNGLAENAFIYPGQILRIRIKVTLTPTLTPTGGPDSTATPTPTLSPPTLLAPANGARIAGNQQVVLQWAANQPLASGAYYLVQVRNTKTGEIFRAITRSNIYRLPVGLRPGAGQSVDFAWRVVIVNGNTVDAVVISGQRSDWIFTWGP